MDFTDLICNQSVEITGHLHKLRPVSAKLCFVILRSGISTIQGVISDNELVKKIKLVPKESIIRVQGIVTSPKTPIVSTSEQNKEIQVSNFVVFSSALSELPFQLEDAMRPKEAEGPKVDRNLLLDYRYLDLRTPTNQAIFRIQSAISQLFREFLSKNKFVEIHTPKLIGSSSEGGSDVFLVKYFNTEASLAQSPQLYKQMAACSGLNRVFELGPVFRAEKSNTYRHLTEFTGLDLEMTLTDNYTELLDFLDELFNFMFTTLEQNYQKELQIIRSQYPSTPPKLSYPSPRLSYPEALKLLRAAGVVMGDLEDLSSENEKLLGKLVQEKYGVDFFIVDKFPTAVRAFYSMPDAANPDYSNSYDMFLRGTEILSGSQRINDPISLIISMMNHNVNPDGLKDYLNSFNYATPLHGGAGIGLERLLMCYLGLDNIRLASMFPRDPARLTP